MFTKDASSEKVILAAILFHPKTVTKWMKDAGNANGRIRIDGTSLLFNLFTYPSQSKVIKWLGEEKFIIYTMTDEKLINSETEAAKAIAKILLDRGFSLEQIKKFRYYVEKSLLSPNSHQAYFVLVGEMSNIPTNIKEITL